MVLPCFLQCATMLHAVLTIAFLSITRGYCIRMNEHNMMLSSQLGSTVNLVFSNIRFTQHIRNGSPLT